MTDEQQQPFGFVVKRATHWDTQSKKIVPLPNSWQVYLPHQCDGWDIAGDDYEGVPLDEAVAELERFIAEASEALVQLKAEREIEEGR